MIVARQDRPAPFPGWRVVRAAFAVAVFGWGVGFYGPPVFLHALHESRGWPVGLVSAAVTLHFLLGALAVANLAALHRRFGVVAVTRAAGLAAACGFLGWALAREPWQLFAATPLTGFGWAGTGAAAINAMVAPWFVRLRPAALSTAYNGASVGGVLFSPLWVALIAWCGLAGAAALLGAAMALALWWLSGRCLGRLPAELGLAPDGDAPGGVTPPARARADAAPLAGSPPGSSPGSPWRDRRFLTLAAGASLGLFAQVGLLAHLLSLLAPAIGMRQAGFALGLATACAVLGRTATGWLLPPGADRRVASAAGYGVQLAGSLAFLAADGGAVLLLGVVLFGLGIGNATSLPPLIAQAEFRPADVARVVALATAAGQAGYAFAPALLGLVRDTAEAALPGGGAVALFAAVAAIQVAAMVVMLRGRPGAVPAE
ncbi:MFS transporter [Roseomonas sp. NAR14]|uniref:MFS transporter n=1 Tax=Roseomonas acroporae TaxID=2937791 RepID=A0A9X1YC67_9PROT|nr:MFS transporter [Roseomonas acroporae]MCK8787443.1 MFS transporter [Roseomonas acroporae]